LRFRPRTSQRFFIMSLHSNLHYKSFEHLQNCYSSSGTIVCFFNTNKFSCHIWDDKWWHWHHGHNGELVPLVTLSIWRFGVSINSDEDWLLFFYSCNENARSCYKCKRDPSYIHIAVGTAEAQVLVTHPMTDQRCLTYFRERTPKRTDEALTHIYHSRFIAEGVAKTSQILSRDVHVSPKWLGYDAADETGEKSIIVWSQSILCVNVVSHLVAFYDERERFFCYVCTGHHTRRQLTIIMFNYLC
jgi:hypothetical protein